MSFWGELRRRKVVQIAAVYAVVAWLLIQVAISIEEPLSLPTWVDTLVIVLLAIGFPVALILSWAYDLTPGGIVLTGDAPSAEVGGAPAAVPDTREGDLPNSVAVLPFENMSPNPDDAYFAAGIHEEVLNQLAKIEDLRVIARTSVLRYEGTRRSIAEIARELRVGTVMEGSVRYAGDRVRVTAQLIEAATEDHLWSEVYERDLKDVFAIQADIAVQIATALEANLTGAEQQRVERPLTQSTEAYVLYLRAMALAREGGIDVIVDFPETREKFESLLDQAIAIDRDFALAYAQRARIRIGLLRYELGTDETHDARIEEIESGALADLDKALELDPHLGIAHAMLARIHQGNWREEPARAAYAEALRLRPCDPEILADVAFFKAMTGERDEAVRLGQRAVALDPTSGLVDYWLAVVYLTIGDPLTALAPFRRAVEHAPTSAVFQADIAALEYMSGNRQVALEHARIAERLLPANANPTHLAVTIYAYGFIGRSDDAKRLFVQLEASAAHQRIAAAAWVYGCLGIGDEARALKWLQRAAENRDPYEGFYGTIGMKVNWFKDPVLEQPDFVAARKNLGFRG